MQSPILTKPEWSIFTRAGHLATVLALLLLGVNTQAADWPAMDCVITPSLTVDVSSGVPGVLDAVFVDRSDGVEAGQVIATLDSRVEQAAVAVAQEKASLRSEVELGNINVEFDQRREQRLASLYSQKAVSNQDKDEAQRNSELSRWKLHHARDLQHLRKLELRKAQEELNRKTVRSPIAGIVVRRFKYSSEYVEDQPIVRIARVDPLYVEAIVSMELFGKIQPGMQAQVVPEMVSTSELQATVTTVDRLGDAASGTFGVRLALPNPGNEIPAGLKCSVKIKPELPLKPVDPPVRQAPPASPHSERSRSAGKKNHDNGSQRSKHISQPEDLIDSRSASACSTIGPLDMESRAMELMKQLQAQALPVTLREQQTQQTVGYIVLTPPADAETNAQLMAAMRDKGIQDMAIMHRGPYHGRIALGVYDNPKAAEWRGQQVQAQGFEAGVQERTKSTARWWLDVSASELKQTLKALPSRDIAGIQIHPTACTKGLISANP